MSDWDLEIQQHLEAHPQRSFKVKELQRALGIPRARYRVFRASVLALGRSGSIALLPRRRVQALSGAQRLEGRILGIGERATHVHLDDGTRLPLASGQVGDVVPGDHVRVRRTRIDGQLVAQVEKTLRAAARNVFGQLSRPGGRWVLIPDDPVPGIRGGFFLLASAELPDSAEGSFARGRLPAFNPATDRPELDTVAVLGPAEHPRPAIARLIQRCGWPQEFSAAAIAELSIHPSEGLAPRDLTDRLVFTIDPADAKDHDDAVDIRREDDGGFTLSVHIADVASFVPESGALDAEARERATSVYPPGSVIPMLPHELSSDACSLHHGVERRCLSVELRYGPDGARHGFGLGLTRIRSRASLAYEHAEALLRQDGEIPPLERLEGGAELLDPLRESLAHMLELASALRRTRKSAGSLFIERPERVFRFDDDGHVAAVDRRESLRSHWIIEEFMLQANRAVAETLHEAGLSLLWRVHENPDETKVDALVEALGPLGIRWNPEEPVSGHDYQELLKLCEKTPYQSIISLLLLRSLMKADYRVAWGGHFGLAFQEYAHFTSPIRRYPDLHNHRCLHLLLEGCREAWLDSAKDLATRFHAGRGRDATGRLAARQLAEHCSERERAGVVIERGAADICAADFLRERVGESFEGMIVGTVPSGVFVELDGAGLDGFVGVEELPGDWYTFDPDRQRFVGERSGRRFGLGQRVRVLLEKVDVPNGRVLLGAIAAL